jgi:hypothetical protein
MLDAVTAALDKTDEGSPPSDPVKVVASETKAETDPTKVATETDLTPEELARLPAKTKKRIQDLLVQRSDVEGKLKALEPKAAQYDVIVKQIRDTGLDQADLNVGFELMTLLKKGDLFGAREKLAPIWAQVSRLTGGVIPQDLNEEIAAGKLTEARARELATARAAAELGNSRQQMAAREAEASAARDLNVNVVGTVNAWEKSKAALDPDWKLKAPEIMRSLKLSLLEGARPKNAQEAVAMAEKALEEVNTRLRSYRPAPRAIKAVVSGVGASSRSNPAEPRNMLDLVRSTLG